jgi:hypothetical protein
MSISHCSHRFKPPYPNFKLLLIFIFRVNQVKHRSSFLPYIFISFVFSKFNSSFFKPLQYTFDFYFIKGLTIQWFIWNLQLVKMILLELYNRFIKDQQYIFINVLSHMCSIQYFHFVLYIHQLMDLICLIF